MARVKRYIDIIEIVENKFPNIGIGYSKERPILVKNAIIGQKLEVDISKSKKGYKGHVLQIVEKSPIELENAECKFFDVCGGCSYQNIPYEEELKIKESNVLKLLKNAGITGFEYRGINPAPKLDGYRNKMEYSFGDECKDGDLALGMRKRNSYYEVVTSDCCTLADKNYNKIVHTTLDYFKNTDEEFYHKMRKTGTLRHLLVRKGEFTGEIVVGLVTTSEIKADLEEYKNRLLALDLTSEIKGIYHIVNDGIADVVKADELKVLYGEDHFFDELLGLKFKISIFSFFQTNSTGAEKLYTITKNMLGEVDDKVVFDLYCGTGTIAQIVAEKAKKVIGIELIEEAVEAAKVNAKLNGIDNVEFLAGDVFKMLDEVRDKPDLIIIDPPREGVMPKALTKLLAYGVEKFVYVSCKPSSLANDLKVFQENGYKVEMVELQDMFPKTYHVETVCLITKKIGS